MDSHDMTPCSPLKDGPEVPNPADHCGTEAKTDVLKGEQLVKARCYDIESSGTS